MCKPREYRFPGSRQHMPTEPSETDLPPEQGEIEELRVLQESLEDIVERLKPIEEGE